MYYANVRENRRGNQELTMRNRKHWAHKTEDEDEQNKKNTQHKKLTILYIDTRDDAIRIQFTCISKILFFLWQCILTAFSR